MIDEATATHATLIRQLQSGELLEGSSWSGAGPWLTLAPGATAGIPFTVKRAGRWRISCEATGFQTTGTTAAAIEVAVYLDGLFEGTMLLASNSPTNVHQVLPRFAFDVDLAAGTHYVAFRVLQGTSNSDDRGSIEVTRVG